ncbi:hypothetical protein BJ912DRAFT_608515 [Pholiota molesta]|nr:hypothetical protein BJ912DRAFT_608515 [Pholiota molesta]
MPGTTHLLTAAISFKEFQSFYSEIFDMIENGTNWDPDDVSDMKHIDPIRFFTAHQCPESKDYYEYIAKFLNDLSRSGEFFIGSEQYGAFAKLLIEYLLTQDLSDNKRWKMHPKIALDLLPQTLSKSTRTAEFAAFLETHVDYLTCSDMENVLYSELNNTADAMKAYESSQS